MAHTGTGGRSADGVGRAALASLLLAVAVAAAPARGEEPGLHGQVEVRAGLLRFDYEERDAGVFLDGEEGFVPSITVEGELRLDRLFGRAMFRLAKGSVDYDGHVQSLTDSAIDGLPVRTTTDLTFLQGELQLGAFVDEGRRLAAFAALGARRWDRDIQETTLLDRTGSLRGLSGLSEVYSWYELQAGVRWTFLQLSRTSWDLDARVVRTAGGEIEVFSPFGAPGSVTMGLGSRTGWRLASNLRRDLAGRLFLAATLWAEGYAFGRSDFHTVATSAGLADIFEPDSSTVNAGLEVGLGGRF